MHLWTIQDKAAYDDLCKNGALHCDEALAEWLKEDNFKKSYDWLVNEMKERVGEPPKGVEYPIWAWHFLDGKKAKPDLRRTEFRNYVGEHYLMEIDIPDEDVLLSDEEYWHFVLNDGYFSDAPDDDEAAIDLEDEWFESLPPLKKERVKRESWKKIFDKDCCPWQFVQAMIVMLGRDGT